jgi:acyl-CoA thioesterase I
MVIRIMNTLVILLFSIMSFGSSVSKDVSKTPQTLVIIGDSITEGLGVKSDEAFPSLLQLKVQKSGKNWKVLNHGISGSTSASAVSRVRWVLKNPPQIVILALGANDGLRAFPPETTKKNLGEAIELLQKSQVKVILAGMRMPPNYQGKFRDQFEKVFPDLAKKYHVKLMPFLLDGVGGIAKLNQKDGIHPNAQGHAIIAENLYKFILTEL